MFSVWQICGAVKSYKSNESRGYDYFIVQVDVVVAVCNSRVLQWEARDDSLSGTCNLAFIHIARNKALLTSDILYIIVASARFV